MAKNLQVNLAFTADTSAAMANLQKLRSSLTEISSMNFTFGGSVSTDLKQASVSAQQLQQHLAAAMDVKTGNLDLNKLQTSLKSSNTSLSSLTSNLLKAGTVGEQAFLSTYQAIAQSNLQLKKSNGLAAQFMATLKNTARWQLSSSLLHGLISGFNQALGYAKELNTSLNNIQIVTGHTSDEMAQFAKQANKAAKELKTTTVAYSDAALIYYQQGLEGDAVTKRANTTVKLANVTRESAETVSQWMTAVWNNFEDGSQSLEYYADVMAALGAATASSSDEIAQGLEKFAAVADTVGLSYEYATSALATITATTRQSADVVGTALKTLFARIQDLDLGKTLEDGTTLGSYSEALYSVGINVKTANGDLKDMDVILDEMGAKWDTLNKDQQVALAKSVAGIRQYTQLIALMDNYDYFQQNVGVAEGAEGTLEEQSQIYEKSWEAATKNVKASMEELYNTLIPTDTLIDLTNGLADVVSGFTSVLEAAGGLKTIMLILANIVLKKFSTQMAMGIDNAKAKMDDLIASFVVLKTNKGFGGVAKEAAKKVFSPITNMAGSAKQMGTQTKAVFTKTTTDPNLATKHEKYQGLSQGYKQQVNEELGYNNKYRKKDIYQGLSPKHQEAFAQKHDITAWDNPNNKANTQNAIDLKNQQAINQELTKRNALQMEQRRGIDAALQSEMKMTEGFKVQLHSLDQIEKHTTAMSNLKSRMSAQEQEVLNTQLEQLRTLGEQRAATAQTISDLKLQVELLKDSASYNFDPSKFKKTDSGHIMADRATGILDADARSAFAKSALEASAGDAYVSVNNQGGTVAFDNTTQASAAQQEMLGILEKTKVLQLEIKDISAAEGPTLEQKKAVMSEIVAKAESEGLISDKTAKSLQGQIKSETSIASLGANIEKRVTSIFKGTQMAAKAMGVEKDMYEKILDIATKRHQAEKNNVSLKNQENQINSQINSNLKKIASKTTTFGTMFTKGIQGASQFAMGLSMVEGAIKSINEEGLNLANISSLLMAAGSFIPALTSGFSAITMGLQKWNTMRIAALALSKQDNMLKATEIAQNYVLKASEQSLTQEEQEQLLTEQANQLAEATGMTIDGAKIALTKAKAAAEKNGAKATDESTKAVIANALATMAHPVMWIVVIILAVIAALVALAALIGGSLNKAIEENRQATIDNSKANIEAIDSNQELAKSVSDLTDKYQELKDNGESTYETMKQLQEQIPKLIDSYAELENTLGIDLGLAQLREAAEYFEKTGDISVFEDAQKETDKKVASAKINEAKRGAAAAREKMVEDASAGDGSTDNSSYQVTIGGTNNRDVTYNGQTMGEEEAAAQILEKNLGDMYHDDQIKFDTTSNSSVLEAYEGMADAKAEMERLYSAEELADMDTYRELKRELEEMSEGYGELSELQSEVFSAAREDFKAGGDQTALEATFGVDGIESLDEYQNKREELIKTLREQYDLTTNQAEALLKESDAFSSFENAVTLFSSDGKIASDIEQKGSLALEEVQKWYDTIPEEDKSLFMGIDFTQVGSIEEAQTELDKIRDQARINSARESAVEAGVDADAFDAYAEILAEQNENLDKNSGLTADVAAANIKLNKGLTKLQDSWEENYKVLKDGNRNTIEYAEALGQLQGQIEDTFGVKPSASFIEKNLKKINDLANGNIEDLQELQDELALDYVTNMEIGVYSVNDGQASVAVATIRDQLREMLESIDTSVEIGEGSTISQEYLNNLQAMIDSGQVTSDQLDSLLAAKGYKLEVSGWKEIDGPKKTIKQTIVDGAGNTSEKTITEQEKIQVPIINGEGQAVKGEAAPAVAIKATSKDMINYSSSKGKQKESENSKKEAKEEIERYHEIQRALERVSKELDRLSAAKDHAFGKDKLAFMDAENAKIKEQIELQDQLVQALQNDLVSDRAAINSYGFSTDENGEINNYDEAYQKAINYYNSLVSSGNQDAADEWWEGFEGAFQQYEETLSNLEDAETEAMNLRYDAEEKRLEDIQTMVEHNLSLTEDAMADLEHQMSKIEDDAFAAAEAIANMGQQAAVKAGDLETYKQGIYDTFTTENAYGSSFSKEEVDALLGGDMSVLEGKKLSEGQIEQIREYRDGIYATTEELAEMGQTVKEKVVENFEAWNEKLERQRTLMEHNHAIMEGYQNIIGLMGADALGISDELLSQMTQQTVKNAEAVLEHARISKEANAKAYEQAKIALAEGAIDEEQFNAIEDAYLESEQNFMDSWNAALEAAGEAFDLEVERILKKFDEAMGGLEEKMEWFDKLQARNEIFYKDYEKMYEISKLNRQITNSMNNTSSIRGQQELASIQEEALRYQEEGVEMSKYDLEYLQKKYDLELARIALEDAQNAKSQVRLTRDSEGNFGYTYTADQAATDKAQQDYEDKLFEMETFLDESSVEIQEQIMDWNTQMMEELGALDKTADDYDQKAQAIVDHYTGLINSISDEGEQVLLRGQEMNQKYGTHAAEVFNETIMGKLYTDIGSYQEYNALVQEAIHGTLQDLEGNYKTYQENTKSILETAGTDVEDFKNKVADHLGEVENANDDLVQNTANMATQMDNSFTAVVDAAKAFQTEYKNTLSPIIKENENIASSLSGIIKEYNKITDESTLSAIEKAAERASAAAAKIKAASGLGGGGGNNTDGDDNKNTEGFWKITGSRKVQGEKYRQYDLVQLNADGTVKTDESGNAITSQRFENDLVNTNGGDKFNNGDFVTFKSSGSTTTAIPGWAKALNKMLKSGNTYDLWAAIESAVTGYSRDNKQLAHAVYVFDGSSVYHPGVGHLSNTKGETLYQSGARDEAGAIKLLPNALKTHNGELYIGLANLRFYKDSKNYSDPAYIKASDLLLWSQQYAAGINENTANYLDYYDTGGYTGEWGPEGRIAMLHQKEIVLNAHDTENFLTAVKIVRTMADQLEANARAAQYGALELRAAGGLPNQGTLEQNVHIEASFPNVTDHNEIEQAFNNIINEAAQYANRK